MKDTFVFYTKYKDQFELMTGDEVKNIMLAMCEYAEEKTVPELSDREMLVFSMIKREMDYDREKYEDVCAKRREAGAKGGKAKQSEANQANAKFAKQTQANQAEYDPDYDTDIKEKDPNGSKKKSSRFSAPTLEDTKTYFADKDFKSDPSAFYDFYTANGWTQGKGKPIKNWQAAANNWERRDRDFGRASPSPNKNIKPTFEQRPFDEQAEKERRFRAMMKAAEDLNEQKAGSG